MIICIGSGKGGTGKTTISTSLALALSKHDIPVQLIDCDVEEPNANLFLKASIHTKQPVKVMVPKIDEELCTHCNKCAEFCRFNSLVIYPDKTLIFPEMCHSCYGCIRICPVDAIKPESREIGRIEVGDAGKIQFADGLLNIGEARATPIISELKSSISPTHTTILDAPPGTSCPFVETARKSDVCILVTEPTPFGLNDLKLAVEVTEILGVPRGVIINCCDVGDDRVERYCEDEGIELLMKIPHERSIAEAYSKGINLVEAMPQYMKLFLELNDKLRRMAGRQR
ncbi:MAG: P-loop NTPase [Deltaproteobacteria bacterium]|nr:P-loop NTPase [Deltaproteobacteria bacterium]